MTPFFDRPRLLLTLTALFWAGNFVLARGIAGHVPPVMLAFLRWTLATLFLLPVAWPYLRREMPKLREQWRILLFLGIVGPAFYNTLSYIGLTSTTATNGLVLNAAGPMVIALTAWAVFGDRIRPLQMAGIACGFLGVLLVIAKADLQSLGGLRLNPGDGMIMASVLCWAIYTAYLRKRPHVSWQSYNFVTYAIAAVANVPFVVTEYLLGHRTVWDGAAFGSILYVAIFPSLLAYIFYNRGVELIGPARTGLFLFLVPVFGASLAAAALGEELHPYHAAGFALIVTGVVLGTRKRHERKIVEPSATV